MSPADPGHRRLGLFLIGGCVSLLAWAVWQNQKERA
jgi:hypothetical protein